MREIKFRSWHEAAKEMTPNCNQGWEGDVFNWLNEGQPITIMQYTGLKDKNGKEIYEGDIVSYWNGSMIADKNGDHYPKVAPYYFSKSKNKCAIVIYEAPSFKIKDGNPLGSQYLMSEDLEVIGNIHETPEFLEK